MSRRTALLTTIMVLAAGVSGAQISGTAHDFSGDPWSGGTICLPCHTPHNAITGEAPLWNHEVTVATFTMYPSGGTIQGTIDPTPAAVSKACLSCHDGTVALENFGGVTTGTTFITGNALLDTDLTNDHPISITYRDDLDSELWVTSHAYGGATIADYLFNNKVECASCHDVHNGGNAAVIDQFLLVEDPAGSAICLGCHNK